MGANYRLIADLGADPPGFYAIDAAGESGEPGSPLPCSQLPAWLGDRHRFIAMDRAQRERDAPVLLTRV
jgi:hypothetical protein